MAKKTTPKQTASQTIGPSFHCALPPEPYGRPAITVLLHRIYRGEKIAPGEPETSVQRPDAYGNSLFQAKYSLFGSKNSLIR